MIPRVLCVVSLAALSAIAGAQTIYVDANAKTGGNGKTWATAFNTLQAGLGAASSGADVWVAAGTYNGGFVIPAGVSVFGGLRNGDLRLTERVFGNASILDGTNSQRVVELKNNSVVDGFTVRNGRGNGGGGARASNVTATIRSCYFTNCSNTSGRGSAVYADNGTLNILNSIFTKNNGFGHVVDYVAAGGVIDHIVIWDNVSNGLHLQGGATCKIYNCIFGMNSGRGMCHISSNDAPVLENNLFWKNNVSLVHHRGRELRSISDVNNLSYAKNNIEGDPKFDGSSFRLLAGSAAIDTGRNMTGASFATRDRAGNGRILDGDLNGSMRTDIGAHEFSNATVGMMGTARPNATVSFRLDATAAAAAGVMMLGDSSAEALVDPYGYLFVNVLRGSAILPWPLNQSVQLKIPADFKPGSALVWQGLVLNATGGNLTNLLDMRVQ